MAEVTNSAEFRRGRAAERERWRAIMASAGPGQLAMAVTMGESHSITAEQAVTALETARGAAPSSRAEVRQGWDKAFGIASGSQAATGTRQGWDKAFAGAPSPGTTRVRPAGERGTTSPVVGAR